MREVFVTVAVVTALALPRAGLAQAEAPAEAPERQRGPRSGFLMQGRLTGSTGAVGVGLGGAAGLGVAGFGAGVSVALGYRGPSWSLAFTPSVASTSSPGEAAVRGTSTSVLGLGALFDAVLARAAAGRVELGLLLGASIGRSAFTLDAVTTPAVPEASDSALTFGALAGVTLRYWLHPSVGVGAELGESVSSVPTLVSVGGVGAGAGPRYGSNTTSFATFGTINVSVVLGG